MSNDLLCYGESGYCNLFDEQDRKTCLDIGENPKAWCRGCLEVGVARLRAALHTAEGDGARLRMAYEEAMYCAENIPGENDEDRWEMRRCMLEVAREIVASMETKT